MNVKASTRLGIPPKNAPATQKNIDALYNGLTSVIAGHPQASDPWTFYEVIDDYLGPWGAVGYPLGYGKFYCVAFNSNPKLSANPSTRRWVEKTTLQLQTALRDFIVARFRAGTLRVITEAELRSAAFASHAQAYADGGLAMVSLVAPELVPIIVQIPIREFVPYSGNAKATWKQVFETLELVAPRAAGIALAAAMPAHSGLFRIAAQRDRDEMVQEQNLNRHLQTLLRDLQSGKYDSMELLDAITSRLNATQYPDPFLARLAKQVIDAANSRKQYVARCVRVLQRHNPEKSSRLDKAHPGWQRWLGAYLTAIHFSRRIPFSRSALIRVNPR